MYNMGTSDNKENCTLTNCRSHLFIELSGAEVVVHHRGTEASVAHLVHKLALQGLQAVVPNSTLDAQVYAAYVCACGITTVLCVAPFR